ncbi:restriction endonuclease subunit R, partial [Candidatus Parcubacteria bacterium]
LDFLQQMRLKDLLRLVYHANAPGELEVIIQPQNRQELAFKHQNAERPFALIKVGDIATWLHEKLGGYEINERLSDAGLFRRLNEDASSITILMGSRAFYEGWDSNRPNVLCYINIGVGEEARKFILQSIGRGVRIEPLNHQRRRLPWLHRTGKVSGETCAQLQTPATLLETLLVFSTRRSVLEKVINQLEKERLIPLRHTLHGIQKNPALEKRLLLIPTYRKATATARDDQPPVAKPIVERNEFARFREFIQTVDQRVLFCLTDATPHQIAMLKKSVQQPDKYYRFGSLRRGNLLTLLHQTLQTFALRPYEVEGFKPLENEIRHFRQIQTTLTDARKIKELRAKIRQMRDNPPTTPQNLARTRSTQGQPEQQFWYEGQEILIKHFAHHYYLPLLVGASDEVTFIQRIPTTRQERRFLHDLEQCLAQEDSPFKEFDWWAFSRIDKLLDEVYWWYHNPTTGHMARFKPGFAFWLQRGTQYWLLFVEPQSASRSDWIHKINGYQDLFERQGRPRVWQYKALSVRVLIRLYGEGATTSPKPYRRYWANSIEELLHSL